MGIEMEFTADRDDFGTVRTVELIPGGTNIPVTDQNKLQYVQMLAAHRMTSAIKVRRRRRRRRVSCLSGGHLLSHNYCLTTRVPAFQPQIDAFLSGFHELVPAQLISIFNEHELELLISGLPSIDSTLLDVVDALLCLVVEAVVASNSSQTVVLTVLRLLATQLMTCGSTRRTTATRHRCPSFHGSGRRCARSLRRSAPASSSLSRAPRRCPWMASRHCKACEGRKSSTFTALTQAPTASQWHTLGTG